MSVLSFQIIKYQQKFQQQVIALVGELLVFTQVIDESNLPVDDDDLFNINQIYPFPGGFWLAIKDKKIIGSVALKDEGSGICELKRMFVLPKYHGKQVGQILLNFALSQASKNGLKKVVLNTNQKMKRAHRFYQKNGFNYLYQKESQLYFEKKL